MQYKYIRGKICMYERYSAEFVNEEADLIDPE